MTNSQTDSPYINAVIANQNTLNRRLLWLFVLPFFITAVIVAMFFRLSARLTDVELGTKLVTIERVLDSDKNYAWAVDQYERLAEKHTNVQVLTRLGILYFLLNTDNKHIALQTLNAAKRLDPSYWEIYRSLTYIYQASDELREAIEAGTTAIKLNKNDANTYNNLAWIYSTSKTKEFFDLNLAKEYAERAVSLTKEKQPNFIDTLASIYAKTGDRKRALEALRKAKAMALDQSGYAEIIQAHFDRLSNEAL